MSASFQPGAIVKARGREWVVLPPGKTKETLRLRPLGGSDDDATVIYLPLEREPPRSATFPVPDPGKPGNQAAGLLLRDALRLKLRAGAGPFRSLGNISVEPRAYQLVPLLMALKQDVVRLLIADDVGIGKTIEAGLIFRELLDRGEIQRLAVICPPHLCEQWQRELSSKFAIDAEVVRSGTAGRLDRGLPAGRSIFEEYPYTIVSLDFIKSERRRAEFLRACPEFVIIEEAHTCVSASGAAKQQRYELLKGLASDLTRHIVMLTATPHSGNEEAFHNLLSLLDAKFADFAELPEGAARKKLREELAAYFVQRRRPDIIEWQDSGLFPKRNPRAPLVPTEATWRLVGPSLGFFSEVLRYARELVERAEGKAKLEQRMTWWSALALLRCVASSPAAAALALETRLKALSEAGDDEQLEEVERIAVETVMDGTEDADLFITESVPAGTTDDTAVADKGTIGRLIEMALHLRGPKTDPKVRLLIEQVTALVKDGFRPIVFCRYIATAHYVAEHLAAALPSDKCEVNAITGELTSEEREEKIALLAETCGTDKTPVLVATDCLSEGVNLQHVFNAVVHYDLSWNPTRHEQREGRVDRYGQKSTEVRTMMLFGDHPVDGAVLQVILRKAEKIKKDLGVSVPMPADGAKVMEAVMQAVLLRKSTPPAVKATNQLSFDFGDLEPVDRRMEKAWQTAKENETKSRTIFAQRRLRPDEVLPEWRKAVGVLGGPADVERFITSACQRLGAPLDAKKGFFKLPLDHLPVALKDRLAAAGIGKPPRIAFVPTHVAGVEVIHRAHPLVIHIADYVAERALSEDDDVLAARCAAVRTPAVKVLTTVHLLRLRSQISVEHWHAGKYGPPRALLAEECLAVAVEGSAAPRLLTETDAMALMAVETAGNLADGQRQQLITRALERLPDLAAAFAGVAKTRADELLADHVRVRTAAVGKGESIGRRYAVTPTLPPDVIGVYVLQPVASL